MSIGWPGDEGAESCGKSSSAVNDVSLVMHNRSPPHLYWLQQCYLGFYHDSFWEKNVISGLVNFLFYQHDAL